MLECQLVGSTDERYSRANATRALFRCPDCETGYKRFELELVRSSPRADALQIVRARSLGRSSAAAPEISDRRATVSATKYKEGEELGNVASPTFRSSVADRRAAF